jgi:hypothetical protein
MNESLPISSNVYYLPVQPPTPEPSRSELGATSFLARAQRTWWRLGFIAAELGGVLRRGGRQLMQSEETTMFGRWSAVPERRSPRYTAPAQVIDFVAARERRRRQVSG